MSVEKGGQSKLLREARVYDSMEAYGWDLVVHAQAVHGSGFLFSAIIAVFDRGFWVLQEKWAPASSFPSVDLCATYK